MFYDARPDSMIVLDCWTHDRVEEKFTRVKGTTEIITTKTEYHDPKGRMQYKVGADFSDAIMGTLPAWIKGKRLRGLLEEANDELEKKDYAPRTLPQILASDKDMYSNSSRPSNKYPSKTSDNFRALIVVDANFAKHTGRLEVVAKQTHGPRQGAKRRKITHETSEDVVTDEPGAAVNCASSEQDATQAATTAEDEGIADMDNSTVNGGDNVINAECDSPSSPQ